ncbi:hypothetical protein TSAR_004920, partial [Trichomalopsis sarcophagae]
MRKVKYYQWTSHSSITVKRFKKKETNSILTINRRSSPQPIQGDTSDAGREASEVLDLSWQSISRFHQFQFLARSSCSGGGRCRSRSRSLQCRVQTFLAHLPYLPAEAVHRLLLLRLSLRSGAAIWMRRRGFAVDCEEVKVNWLLILSTIGRLDKILR